MPPRISRMTVWLGTAVVWIVAPIVPAIFIFAINVGMGDFADPHFNKPRVLTPAVIVTAIWTVSFSLLAKRPSGPAQGRFVLVTGVLVGLGVIALPILGFLVMATDGLSYLR